MGDTAIKRTSQCGMVQRDITHDITNTVTRLVIEKSSAGQTAQI